MRVVGAEVPLLLVPDRALEQGPEDLRLDVPPAEQARAVEELQLIEEEVQASRMGEERPVRVRRAGVDAVGRPGRRGVVQVLEQAAELVRARPLRMLHELLDDAREPVPGNLAEVLGEHAPHRLQEEVPPVVRAALAPVCETLVERRDGRDGLARDGELAAAEDRLATGEEQQRVVLVRELFEAEHGARSSREPARLPDLEPPEGAEHDVRRSRTLACRVSGVTPVVECLIAMLRQTPGLGGRLHLDDAHARPGQIEETAFLWSLELRARRQSLGAVAREQLVEERLRLRPLAAVVQAPARGEACQAGTELVAGQRHPPTLHGHLLLRHRPVRRLHQAPVLVAHDLDGLLQCADEVPFGSVFGKGAAGPLGALARLGHVEQDVLDLAHVSFVHGVPPRVGIAC